MRRILWLAPLMAGAGIVLGACSGGAPAPETAVVPPGGGETLVVNVAVNDDGFEPAVVYFPRDRQIQLVMRNRTPFEHHYHVGGMPMTGLLWPAPDEVLDDMASHEHDHGAQGSDGLVDYHICTSQYGVCPSGDWVHAHSQGLAADTIFFTPTTAGEYTVTCPLHPELTAKVVVY